MITSVDEPGVKPPRRPRSESREAAELRALRERQPELAEAADMHLELLELQRRVQGRVSLPSFELSADVLTRHQAEARPLLRFEQIPLELTDLRLVVRQTLDVLRRYGALDNADVQRVEALGRDVTLVAVAGRWYRSAAERHADTGTEAVSHPTHAQRDGESATAADWKVGYRRSTDVARIDDDVDLIGQHPVEHRQRIAVPNPGPVVRGRAQLGTPHRIGHADTGGAPVAGKCGGEQ